MGWILFAIWMFLGVVVNIANIIKKGSPKDSIDYKVGKMTMEVCMWIGIVTLALVLLYCLGWVWYYFCGGFLVFEDQPFWDKVICGLITLIPFGFLLGIIRICCGWDPFR